MDSLKYMKPHKTYTEQVQLLESRGIIIDDKEFTEQFLSNVNYYKLSGYFK
jgi:abortive infection bacteriophage resistance protein